MNCQRQYLEITNDSSLLTPEVYLSDMAFWNPAELIGNNPSYLAYSLFNNLIMKSSWNEGLISLGTIKVDGGLMEPIASKPYVNVHKAFLSLLSFSFIKKDENKAPRNL